MHDHIQQSNLDDQSRHTQLSTDTSSDQSLTPSMQGNTVQRRAAVLQMQRQHGNAFVRRQLGNVQRVEIDEVTSAVDTEPSANAGASSTTSIGDGSASISAQNGVVNIDASRVNINAPFTQHSGVDKSSTVITDSVIAASYSPGAGNVW